MALTAFSASRAICWPTPGFSVWKAMVNRTPPPSIWMSRTKPNETMSRDSPGKRTFFSASRTWSCVGIRFLFLFLEAFVGGGDDRNGLLGRPDDGDDLEVLLARQVTLHHGPIHPLDQPRPCRADQDQRMLGHVLDLQELPHHEQLQRRSNAPGHDDERR